MNRILAILTIFFGILSISESSDKVPQFGQRQDLGLLASGKIDEASGLAASRKYPGIFWTHNDSGDKDRIFAIDRNGNLVGEFELDGINVDDLEDICVGPGPEDGKSYIYVGDIGDNDAKRGKIYVYRIEEPDIDFDKVPLDKKLKDIDEIKLDYPDGSRDAETLMIDPLTKDIYIVTKREENVRVYVAEYPQNTDKKNELLHIATLTIGNMGFEGSGVVGGDISPDGLEIILKDYAQIYYYSRKTGEPLAEAFISDPAILPYIPEPQGEAVCWDVKNGGYYTLSESNFGIKPHLYYYPRITTSVKKKIRK